MSKTPMRLRCRCCGAESHSDIRHDRRQLMAGLVALAALPVLAACDRKEEQSNTSIKPVEISEGTACELDGMLLSEYPGPKGQIHFANTPEPAFYCDTMEVPAPPSTSWAASVKARWAQPWAPSAPAKTPKISRRNTAARSTP